MTLAIPPQTRYAKLGNDRIAYQVVGEGPIDLLVVSPGVASVDVLWEWPPSADFFRRLASFTRFIVFDRRGWGASDRASDDSLPPWEIWADDVRAVLDEVSSERAAIFAWSDSASTAILFAVTEPERTQSLILFTATARFLVDDNYPWGLPAAALEAAVNIAEETWGTEDSVELGTPSMAHDEVYRRWFAKAARLMASPRDAGAYYRLTLQMDVRDVLPSVRVPTLILHRKDFQWIPPEHGRYLAENIRGAKFVLVPGADAAPIIEPTTEILESIEEFLTGARSVPEPDRVLAAVLFTDIVGSTQRAAELGDRRWHDLLESHAAVARTVVEQHRGRLIKTTGDGILATFDGPGRAIRCASALRDALRALGLEIRAGLHTGEVELIGEDVGGIGVHVAARVLEHAAPGELLVSHAVPVLVAGSDITFEDRGECELKGVPGEWRLFAVQN